MEDCRRRLPSLKRAVVLLTAALCALFGLQLVGMSAAFANAANPDPTTSGTSVLNADGTVTAHMNGTWSWPGQNCAGRYGIGVAVDWWGISSSPTASPNFTLTDATTVTAPGQITNGSVTSTGSIKIGNTGMYFHVGDLYAGESVNSASTCTDVDGGSAGSWSAAATYPSQADVPGAVCVNMYDDHGKEGHPSTSNNDYSPINDHDNSILTNHFDPTSGMGYCVALQPVSQQIRGEIYLCSNGSPTTTLASGGTIAVPAANLSSSNPLAPTDVAAGTYTMNATAPSGQQFVACGQSGVTITSPSSAHRSVTVPSGGTGNGKFYVAALSYGYIEVCKSSANGVSGYFKFHVSSLPNDLLVAAGACTHPLRVPTGVTTVTEAYADLYRVQSIQVWPNVRIVQMDLAARSIAVRVVEGGVGKEVVVTFVNQFAGGLVKICQVAGAGVALGTDFAFTSSATPGVLHVPAGASPDGKCAVLGNFRVQTTITIQQQIPTGYSVSAIDVLPAVRLVGSPNLGTGTVTIRVDRGVTAVRYTDTQP